MSNSTRKILQGKFIDQGGEDRHYKFGGYWIILFIEARAKTRDINTSPPQHVYVSRFYQNVKLLWGW